MQKKKCYSYVRWSSDKQSTGTTKERQTTLAYKVADELGLELVEVLDAGVSAFRGRNAQEGKLKDFIDAVKAGAIPSDSVLVVENLDRLSRDSITEALPLFIELLKLGLTIYTGEDKRLFTQESVNRNPTDLMLSILLFSRAHEESLTKSDRTLKNALTLIRRHQHGERVNIKSVGSNVWWVDDSGATIEPHPVYFPIAQEIIKLTLSGWGSYLIADHLNERYPPPKTNKLKVRPERWSINLLRKFHISRALLGEKRLKLNGNEYVLENYYPALVDEASFYRIRELKQHHRATSTSKEYVSLATGIGVAKCKACGCSLSAFRHRGKLRYICLGGQTKMSSCPPWSFSAHLLDDTIIRFCLDKLWQPAAAESTEHSDEIVRIKGQLKDLEDKINGIADLIADNPRGRESAALRDRLIGFEEQKAAKSKELEELYAKAAASPTHSNVDHLSSWKDISPDVLKLESTEERLKVRELIKASLKKIEAEKMGSGYRFNFIFRDGEERACYRDKHKLVIEGDVLGKSVANLMSRNFGLLEWGNPPDFVEDESNIYRRPGHSAKFAYDDVDYETPPETKELIEEFLSWARPDLSEDEIKQWEERLEKAPYKAELAPSKAD